MFIGQNCNFKQKKMWDANILMLSLFHLIINSKHIRYNQKCICYKASQTNHEGNKLLVTFGYTEVVEKNANHEPYRSH